MQPLENPICCTFKLYPMIIETAAAKAATNNISSAQLIRIVELSKEWERSQSDILAILVWNGDLRTELFITRCEA